MSNEITVNLPELEKAENKLSNLGNRVENRKTSCSLVRSKGSVPDEMLTSVDILNEMGIVLANLIKQTEAVIINTRLSFANADKQTADMLKTNGE